MKCVEDFWEFVAALDSFMRPEKEKDSFQESFAEKEKAKKKETEKEKGQTARDSFMPFPPSGNCFSNSSRCLQSAGKKKEKEKGQTVLQTPRDVCKCVRTLHTHAQRYVYVHVYVYVYICVYI
jgi:hypothetical protein